MLTFPSAEDATKPGLRVTVKLEERSFEATGEEFGVATLQVRQVFWSDVLRLRKTGTAVDAAGRTQSQFYMAFVDGGRYRVWRNATISTTTSAMPVTACTRRDGVAVTCTATDVNGIFDYVGERYRQPRGITAF